MYCPNCGKANRAEQKFCRSCGLSLEKVARVVAEQLPATEQNRELQNRQRQVERWLLILSGSAFAVFVGAIIWTIIYKTMIVKGELFAGFVFLAMLVATVSALLLVIYREHLRDALSKGRLAGPTLPQAEETAKLLTEPSLEPVPSVTERTTERLVAEKKSVGG